MSFNNQVLKSFFGLCQLGVIFAADQLEIAVCTSVFWRGSAEGNTFGLTLQPKITVRRDL